MSVVENEDIHQTENSHELQSDRLAEGDFPERIQITATVVQSHRSRFPQPHTKKSSSDRCANQLTYDVNHPAHWVAQPAENSGYRDVRINMSSRRHSGGEYNQRHQRGVSEEHTGWYGCLRPSR